jgi:hypothetical protein
MIQENDLQIIFLNAIDVIIPDEGNDNECGVFLGWITPIDAPSGLAAVMDYYTKYIDGLLQSLPMTPLQHIELVMLRCFSHEEYKCLFLSSIKEKDFHAYPIFRTLLITTSEDRLYFTRSRDDSYEAYTAFLEGWTKNYNPFLHTFLYGTHTDSTTF